MELHHIVQIADGGADTFENAVPLCFDCHAEVKSFNPHHPKGSKITENELRAHRDSWYGKVAQPIAYSNGISTAEVDKKVFYALNRYLCVRYLEWIRDQNLGDSFRSTEYNYFRKFLEKIKLPSYEFFNADLETAKANLADSIRVFYDKASSYIFCEDDICRIPNEWRVYEPELYKESYRILNKLANEIWVRYCEYIHVSKLLLNIAIASTAKN